MGDIIAKLVKFMWRDDLIQLGWYVKTNRVDRMRYQGEKHTFDTSITPTVLKCGTYLTFFTWIGLLWYLWYILGFHIRPNNVTSSELIWATTCEDEGKLLNRTGSVLYVPYVTFDKSPTWLFSVHDCWHDYERQYQSYIHLLSTNDWKCQ